MNVYEIITERITKKLEEGVVPWHQPWKVSGHAPQNYVSKHEYQGINVFLLNTLGYEYPFYLTWKQVEEIGGTVKEDQRKSSYPVVFWKRSTYTAPNPKTGEDEEKQGFILRYFRVYNIAQCEGIKQPEPIQETHHEPIKSCEDIIKGYVHGPVIQYGFNHACYVPKDDRIEMPNLGRFEKPEWFYSTLFHEATHSTGHADRTNRRPATVPRYFGDPDYSKEELVAEMGACFLSGHAGIEQKTIENSASYLDHWIKVLKSNPKWLVQAASQAEKAVKFILGTA